MWIETETGMLVNPVQVRVVETALLPAAGPSPSKYGHEAGATWEVRANLSDNYNEVLAENLSAPECDALMKRIGSSLRDAYYISVPAELKAIRDPAAKGGAA